MKSGLYWATGILTLLATLYVGSYFALVETSPGRIVHFNASRTKALFQEVTPEYAYGGLAAESFFAPVHWLDTKFRSATWIELLEECEPGLYRIVGR